MPVSERVVTRSKAREPIERTPAYFYRPVIRRRFAGQTTTHRVGSRKPAPIGYPHRREVIGQQVGLDVSLAAIGVHTVHRIGGGVFVAALAFVGKRVHAEEASHGGVVVSRPQVIQAEVGGVLFAAVASHDNQCLSATQPKTNGEFLDTLVTLPLDRSSMVTSLPPESTVSSSKRSLFPSGDHIAPW